MSIYTIHVSGGAFEIPSTGTGEYGISLDQITGSYTHQAGDILRISYDNADNTVLEHKAIRLCSKIFIRLKSTVLNMVTSNSRRLPLVVDVGTRQARVTSLLVSCLSSVTRRRVVQMRSTRLSQELRSFEEAHRKSM